MVVFPRITDGKARPTLAASRMSIEEECLHVLSDKSGFTCLIKEEGIQSLLFDELRDELLIIMTPLLFDV